MIIVIKSFIIFAKPSGIVTVFLFVNNSEYSHFHCVNALFFLAIYVENSGMKGHLAKTCAKKSFWVSIENRTLLSTHGRLKAWGSMSSLGFEPKLNYEWFLTLLFCTKIYEILLLFIIIIYWLNSPESNTHVTKNFLALFSALPYWSEDW